ncbi:MAG: 1-acyl-sn-glycerol-3-phosphate acyltransferase, partial [Lachnospiraceae bacterium]|nr:1-acyl-sn-glycerol-3-phosphate acyltransferase [Lachnospiraceae bacterium]
MFRLIVIVFWNMYQIPYMVLKMRYMAKHPKRFSELDRYRFAQHEILCMNQAGKIETEVYGKENLPKEGGYIMYPNHQGKYDATGIIFAHDK